MQRLTGLLVLGIVIGVVGGCRKSANEKLIGKWQPISGGSIAEVLPDGTVAIDGKVSYRYEILDDGRLKTWPLKYPSHVETNTIAFTADTLITRRDQLLVTPDLIDIDSTYVRTLDTASFEASRVRKWVRVR
jgi:hypothetical protein